MILSNYLFYTYIDDISSVTVKSLTDASPLVVIVNQEVVFTAVVTSLAGTTYYTPVTYQWDFGDGNNKVSTEASVIYSYSTPGVWNITLTAANNVSSAIFIGKINILEGLF